MHSIKGMIPLNLATSTSISMLNKHSKKIGKYIVEKTLCKSKNKVKKGIDHKKAEVAIKCFRYHSLDETTSAFDREKTAYSVLNHKHVIKLIDTFNYQKISKNVSQTKNFKILVIEFASKRDLFEYVRKTGRFCEDMARILFKQLLLGVQYIHISGIAHMDLKLDNLLLTENFTLKIVDFDLARPLKEICKGFKIGTQGYFAPEILEVKDFKGAEVDIFTLGIILFTLCAQYPPFENAREEDIRYRLIINKNYTSFWEIWEKYLKNFSTPLKNLIQSLLAYNPQERPSVSEILNCEWMKMRKDDRAFYRKNMRERFEIINNLP